MTNKLLLSIDDIPIEVQKLLPYEKVGFNFLKDNENVTIQVWGYDIKMGMNPNNTLFSRMARKLKDRTNFHIINDFFTNMYKKIYTY